MRVWEPSARNKGVRSHSGTQHSVTRKVRISPGREGIICYSCCLLKYGPYIKVHRSKRSLNIFKVQNIGRGEGLDPRWSQNWLKISGFSIHSLKYQMEDENVKCPAFSPPPPSSELTLIGTLYCWSNDMDPVA